MSQWTRAFTGGSLAGHWRVTLDYIITEQDVANNRSYIELRNYVYSDGSAYTQNGLWDGRLYLNGGEVNRNTPTANVGTGWYLLNAWGTWVYHNADGSLYVSIGNYVNAPVNDANHQDIGWTLPTIPRASQPSLVANPTSIGTNLLINMNRLSGAFTHTVSAAFGSWSATLATGVVDQYTWNTSTVESNLYAQIPNNSSGNGTITVDTYSGGTYVGTKTVGFTLTVDPTVASPTFTNFTFKDSNATTSAITGNDQVLIQGISTLEAKIIVANKMIAQKSATAKNYTATIDGVVSTQNYSATVDLVYALGVIAGSGTRTIGIRANDSRDYSATVNKSVEVLPYVAPVISPTASRANNFDNATTIKVSGTFSRLTVAGTDKNSITASSLKYRTRQDGGAWGSFTTMTFTQTAGTFTATDVVLSLVNSSQFDIEVSVTDKIGTVTQMITVDRGTPIFMINDNGAIGVNQMPDPSKKGLQLTPTDNFWLQMYAVGDIFMTTNSANPSARFGGTWVAWGTGRVPVGIDGSQSEFNTVEKTGGEKAHVTTVGEMPAHSHSIASGSTIMYDLGISDNRWGNQWATTTGYHSVGGYLNNTGGGAAHNNLQPFITCYMWKRTA